jgi:hypothetical protein
MHPPRGREDFDVGVISYGASVRSGFSGALGGKILHPLSQIEAWLCEWNRCTRPPRTCQFGGAVETLWSYLQNEAQASDRRYERSSLSGTQARIVVP